MKVSCPPGELSLKSFFVGPQAENAELFYSEIKMVLDYWVDWRKEYYPNDGIAISKEDQEHPEFQKKIIKMREETLALLEMFSKEIPKFSPRYLGHMFSEISMPAMIGHIITLLYNPNNVSKESSWVGVSIEKEAVQKLCQMVGYTEKSIGHFTSGGTIANFEAILRAKNKILNYLVSNSDKRISFNDACYLQPSESNTVKHPLGDIELYKFIKQQFQIDFNGFTIVVPDNRHYSWAKGASLFGIGVNNLTIVNLNKYGQMCHLDLEKKIDACLAQKKTILCITSVLGSTELGTIDPIDKVNEVLGKYKKEHGYNFWHHIDAAYGGFFACLKESDFFKKEKKDALRAVEQSSSITIDPHKLGYVPYASGAFLCKDPADYYIHEVSAPYVNFELRRDLGPYTIEGSRPATGAVALYMTSKCIGLNKDGYGKILERTIQASEKLQEEVKKNNLPIFFIETVGTNIVCFAIGQKGDRLSSINTKTTNLLEKILKTEPTQNKNDFFVSKTRLRENYKESVLYFCEQHGLEKDCNTLDLVRLTIMNPFVNSINSNTNYLSEFLKYIKLHIEATTKVSDMI